MSRRVISALACVLLFGCVSADPESVSRPADAKLIALTYDDAPLGTGPLFSGRERTDAIIQQLDKAESGPVAFFITTRGFRDEGGKTRVADYAAAGHLIANHSDQHDWASRTPTADYIADIDRAETHLEGFDNRRPWFRFPFLDEGGMGEANASGEKRDALRAALAERGLISGYVTVDTYDWHLDRLWSRAVRDGQSVDMEALSRVYVDMVLDAANHYDALGQRVLERRPVQVLLLHENDLAASFTTAMVDALRADGWEIVHPDTAFADPIADQLPETKFSGGGRISALAADKGWRDRGTLDHWSVSEAAIGARVRFEGVFKAPSETDSAN